MSEKIEGTLILDGMIEGRLPDNDAGGEKVRGWGKFAETVGVRFTATIDGGSFSLLADNRPMPSEALSPDPAQKIADLMNQFLKLFPVEDGRVFSTLRSVEYQKGSEVQTLYVVGHNGKVEFRQRTVEAQTTPPEATQGLRSKLRLGVMGLVVALVVFAVSTLFVDYRGLWVEISMSFTPVREKDISVDAGVFARYVTVQAVKVENHGRSLRVTLARTGDYPGAATQPAATQPGAATQPAMQPVSAGPLADHAVEVGYLRAELFDAEGHFLAFETVRIKDLASRATIDFVVPSTLRNAEKRDVRVRRILLAP